MAEIKPVMASPVTQATPVPAGGADRFQVDLFGGCSGAACCPGCCCPCCVVGANDKMVKTGDIYGPMDGCGGVCIGHALIGGCIQGVAIFFLGPLAGLVHAG